MTASPSGIAGYPTSDNVRFDLVVEAIKAAGLGKTLRNGDGLLVSCPAHHPDKTPSLSVRLASDGRVLLHCFATCRTEDVLRAAGVAWGDLFAPDDLTPNRAIGRRDRSVARGHAARQNVPVPFRVDQRLRGVDAGPDEFFTADDLAALWERDGPEILSQPGRVIVSQDLQDPSRRSNSPPDTYSFGDKHVRPVTSAPCQARFGVVFRHSSNPTKGIVGGFRCRATLCADHGAENRASVADRFAGQFAGRVWRVEVRGVREWVKVRQRLCRIRKRTGDEEGHGWKIPAPGPAPGPDERCVLYVDTPMGEPVESVVEAIHADLAKQPLDGRKRNGIGGWTVEEKRDAPSKWELVRIVAAQPFGIRTRLHRAGIPYSDLSDDELARFGLADGFRVTLPGPDDSGGWAMFDVVMGAIEPAEFFRRRSRKRRRLEAAA